MFYQPPEATEQQRWPAISSLMVFVSVSFWAGPAWAADSVKSAIDEYEAATKTIRSYDVALKCEEHFIRDFDPEPLNKARLEAMKGRGVGPITLRLIDLPKPTDRVTYWRQVKDGSKRRIEQLDGPGGVVRETHVTDGTTARYLMPASGQGAVDRITSNFATTNWDYECLYRDIALGASLATIFRERATTRLAMSDSVSDVTIEALPVAEASSFPRETIAVTCDKLHGMLPKRIEFKSSRHQWTTEIEKYEQIRPNDWVPVCAKTRSYLTDDGKIFKFANERSVTLDVPRCRWNVKIPPETFRLRFPPGILVFDRVRNMTYTAGGPNSDKP
jgi:hypothetical protein